MYYCLKTGCNWLQPVFKWFVVFLHLRQPATGMISKVSNRNWQSGCNRSGWVQFWSFFRSMQSDPQTLFTFWLIHLGPHTLHLFSAHLALSSLISVFSYFAFQHCFHTFSPFGRPLFLQHHAFAALARSSSHSHALPISSWARFYLKRSCKLTQLSDLVIQTP